MQRDDGSAGPDGVPPLGLPASFEQAWGVRDRPTKGPKRAMSLERVVEAGIEVADSEGLPAVSMSRVAKQLGASTMSLYRYVGSKEELLLLMADQAMAPPPEHDPGENWRTGLILWCQAELAEYLRRPWVLRVPLSGPPVTPNSVAWMNDALTCLGHTGMGEWEKLSSLLMLTSYVRAQAGFLADITAAVEASGTTVETAIAQYGAALDRLVDGERLPAVRALIDSGILSQEDEPGADFLFGLDRILDGIAVFIGDPPVGSGRPPGAGQNGAAPG